jgi:hypothetical protein
MKQQPASFYYKEKNHSSSYGWMNGWMHGSVEFFLTTISHIINNVFFCI